MFTCNSSGNIWPQSSELAEPPQSGTGEEKLISTEKKQCLSAGGDLFIKILPLKSLYAKKKAIPITYILWNNVACFITSLLPDIVWTGTPYEEEGEGEEAEEPTAEQTADSADKKDLDKKKKKKKKKK